MKMKNEEDDYKPSVCSDDEAECDDGCPSCIPELFKNLLEEIKDHGVPSARKCFVDGMPQKCKAAGVDLEFCDDDDKDQRPTCVVSEVTWEDETGKMPPKTFNVSCPSCVPKGLANLCKKRPMSKCDDDNKFAMKWDDKNKDLCPSCFKVKEKEDCTLEERKQCLAKVKTMDKCGERENAIKDDCCWSCKPRELPEDAEKKREMVEKCAKKIKGKSKCEEAPDGDDIDDREEDKKVGSRDADGCRSCAPPTKERAKKEDKCTLEDLKQCREDSPDCELEEKPLVDEDSLRCCAPCIRPASKVHLLRVIACRKFLKECDDDEDDEPDRKRNSFLPGEACPICGTKRPKCEPGCNDKQLCIHVRRDGTATKKCIPKRRIKLILKLKQSIRKEIRQASKETMTGVLREFIQRFCEQNSEAQRCAQFKDKLLDSLECTKKTNGTRERKDKDNVVEIEVEFGDEEDAETENGRRLLSETATGAESLLSDATKHDSDYVEGVEGDVVTPGPDSSASSPCIFLTTVFLSILALSQF